MVSRIERGAVANWFWTVDRFLLISFIVLILLGFMLSFSASPAVAERIGLDSFHFVKRFAIFMVPTVAIMIAISFLDSRMVRRAAALLLVGSLVMMVLLMEN